jgi:hypothetical protein
MLRKQDGEMRNATRGVDERHTPEPQKERRVARLRGDTSKDNERNIRGPNRSTI